MINLKKKINNKLRAKKINMFVENNKRNSELIANSNTSIVYYFKSISKLYNNEKGNNYFLLKRKLDFLICKNYNNKIYLEILIQSDFFVFLTTIYITNHYTREYLIDFFNIIFEYLNLLSTFNYYDNIKEFIMFLSDNIINKNDVDKSLLLISNIINNNFKVIDKDIIHFIINNIDLYKKNISNVCYLFTNLYLNKNIYFDFNIDFIFLVKYYYNIFINNNEKDNICLKINIYKLFISLEELELNKIIELITDNSLIIMLSNDYNNNLFKKLVLKLLCNISSIYNYNKINNIYNEIFFQNFFKNNTIYHNELKYLTIVLYNILIEVNDIESFINKYLIEFKLIISSILYINIKESTYKNLISIIILIFKLAKNKSVIIDLNLIPIVLRAVVTGFLNSQLYYSINILKRLNKISNIIEKLGLFYYFKMDTNYEEISNFIQLNNKEIILFLNNFK